MRKQSVYDFEKLFMGHNLKKTAGPVREVPSRQATAQRERPKQHVNNYTKKPAGIKLHMKTSSNVSSVSSRGSSAEKTSRKPSHGNIQLIIQKVDGERNMGGLERANKELREEVENFYNGLGNSTLVKYAPVAINTQKKSVKRDLTNLLSSITSINKSPEKTLPLPRNPVIMTERLQANQHKLTKIVSQQSRQISRQPKKLAHKDSLSSFASSCSSSRYLSINQGSTSNLKSIQEKFKQSQEKISRLRDRLSQLYSLKTESSQKSLAIKPKCKLTRYESILLR